ncbi:katanin p80 WD40 repeat-containing subunit B1 homolog isoform X1 [Brachypodium distachyon]|uniref:katanin p80 WD40 repeat-containing subunit B1 homolog isoform X1 n=2 Tax=Brachypodium distachyon TaxID=15368 RepID=UPI00071C473D|nr:katanin p80 WD40 repeat-containing subunit B1 homolog isoform X1 [Brachypodium distachyon]|eukprot:XP_014756269.1 katanin p80 WD40 repeat-containing subunit B1 homolog isoform X1 [Brachypodium distachyon]
MIGAGAASGTIKIWDIEEAKVVRTFTGHRSNCVSLDFHPFGEFFASGSSDTNMKIWDMRKKRCIHTYQGHTRRIDVLRFTPDGRWIVSGGADNSVKIWDLTAGKLLHDFTLHEGPVNCLDFHPHEFLLATGSADKTVKFWDLETFELIGSSGPENCREYYEPASVVRSMTFNSDGKALFCGLHESLKVLSWEPIICHDVVDVGWSTLADLNVQEGKLLGCSYNQSCVGIWVVDLTRIEPYAVGNAEAHLNESGNGPIQADSSIPSILGRLSVSRIPAANEISSNTLLKRSMSASNEIHLPASSSVTNRLSKAPGRTDLRLTRADSAPLLSPRGKLNPNSTDDQKRKTSNVRTKVYPSTSARMFTDNSQASAAPSYRPRSTTSACSSKGSSFVPVVPRHSSKVDAGPNLSEAASTDIPVVEPENLLKGRVAVDNGKEMRQCVFQSKPITSEGKFIRQTSGDGDINCFGTMCTESVVPNEVGDRYDVSGSEEIKSVVGRNPEFVDVNRTAFFRLHRLVESSESSIVERRGAGPSCASYGRSHYTSMLDGLVIHYFHIFKRRQSSFGSEQSASANDEDVIADLMKKHQEFIHGMKPRLTKLELVYQCWQNNDIKGSVNAVQRMLDHAVTADIISVLMESTTECITLDICTSVLPLASNLLESIYERHLNIALGMILKLVKSFGPTICSTLSAAPPVGVDLEAEQRFERCHSCFQELKKVNSVLISLTRRQGNVGRSARKLSLFLQDIFKLPSSV